MNTLPLLLIVLLPFAALAYWKQVFPHRQLVWVALVPAILSLGLIVAPEMLWPLLVLSLVGGGVVAADLATLPRHAAFSVARHTGRIASLRASHRVTLVVTNLDQRDRAVRICDGAPPELHAEPDGFEVTLPARRRATLHYEVRADRRGKFTLHHVYLYVQSRLALWQRQLTYPAESRINVYPDMQQLSEYSLLARTNRQSLMGFRRTRRIGQDHDFERLRDYTRDDNYKHIHWRSSARRNKLTVKDFQASQSQRLVFLIDCGRMMTGEHQGLSLLDHALNAMLMLSFVALRQGDQVGLLCFSDAIHAYVPPRGGMHQMNQLLHASFDRFPQMVESRYDQAFLHLAAHCRKRALVVLITNVIDEVNAHQIQQYLTNLVGRHLPLGVLLRDHRMFDPVEFVGQGEKVPSGDRLYRAAAAAEIVTWRHQVLSDLENKGVLILDAFPEKMTAPLVNRYLDAKARHLL